MTRKVLWSLEYDTDDDLELDEGEVEEDVGPPSTVEVPVQLPPPLLPPPQMLASVTQLQPVLPPSTTPISHPEKTRATDTGHEGTAPSGIAQQTEPMDLSSTAAPPVQAPLVQLATQTPVQCIYVLVLVNQLGQVLLKTTMASVPLVHPTMGTAWMRPAQLTVQPTVQPTIVHMQPTVSALVQSTALSMSARLA